MWWLIFGRFGASELVYHFDCTISGNVLVHAGVRLSVLGYHNHIVLGLEPIGKAADAVS